MSFVDTLIDAWGLLTAGSSELFFGLFWLAILIEIPRYFLGLQATAAALLLRGDQQRSTLGRIPKISIIIAGHNEEHAIEKCVHSLRGQTIKDFEIVCVDDGSSDATFAVMSRLRRDGLVTAVARLELRGGKPAGLNLGARLAKGDIFIVVDCDCTFAPNAIEELIRPLIAEPGLGAVCGNILVRNWRHSLVTALQSIEYLVSISLGKSYSAILDQISCVSGAFGAFRRQAWERIGGMDPSGAEDFDFTMRLRLAGYKVAFARHAVCFTDVPDTVVGLIRQRNRWERDTFWVRLRKHRRIFNPFGTGFSWRDLLHQWDFLLFSLLPTAAFPFYLTWLLTRYGELGVVLLVQLAIILLALDLAVFSCAVLVTGNPIYWRLLPFLPLYGLFQSYVMRLQRFYAFATEWIYSSSLTDNYTPEKTRVWCTWK